MKKLILILLLLNFNKVKAYENKYILVDIPKEYTLNEINDHSYKWENNNNYIALTISNNKKLYNIKTYTDKDINNQKKYIEDNINNELKDYNIKVNVSNIKKEKQKNYYSLNYNIYWPSKEYLGYDTYQIGNIYTTNNYIITLIYSSDNKINNNEYKNIINSLKIKDQNIKNNSLIINIIIIVGFILALINVVRKHKKRV